MVVSINLDFDTLDELPGKLRVAACVGPVVPLQMSQRLALALATKLDHTHALQADCDELRRLGHDVMAARADWDRSAEVMQQALQDLLRRIWVVVALSFASGLVAGLGLHFAGWI